MVNLFNTFNTFNTFNIFKDNIYYDFNHDFNHDLSNIKIQSKNAIRSAQIQIRNLEGYYLIIEWIMIWQSSNKNVILNNN